MLTIAELPEYTRKAQRNELAELVDLLVKLWIQD
jgi:hypothetical protein